MDFSIRPLTFDEIISRDDIRTKARIAADNGENVNAANPYPADSPAHLAFEHEYWAAVHDGECLSLV